MRSISAILVIFVAAVSCCDEPEPPLVCGVQDPIKELEWLKEIVAELDKNQNSQFYLEQGELHGNTYFFVNNCCHTCDVVFNYYDCSGRQIEPANLDPSALENRKILWKPDNFACDTP